MKDTLNIVQIPDQSTGKQNEFAHFYKAIIFIEIFYHLNLLVLKLHIDIIRKNKSRARKWRCLM